MRIEYFRTFIEVVEKGGFLRAARELGVTQATVSNHIAALEGFFGVTLFDRSKRAVRLTKEGEVLLERAKEILKLVDETKEELKKMVGEKEERIRIVASTIPGEHILPKLVARFREENPKVSFEIEVLDTGGALRKLLRGEADLAAVGSLMEESVKEIEAVPIGKEKLIFICPVDHELTREKKVTLEDCLNYPFVSRGRTSGTRIEVEKAFMQLGIPLDRIKISLEAGSTEAVINAVSVGLGITVLSETAAKKAESAGLVKIIKVEGWNVERTLYLVRDKRRKMSAVVEEFWRFASERGAEAK
ncbi:MAG: LysR family transcriptional regulator [Candidatus Freyarchaeota archaeon]|nr:LysR family transcriptional regulator [Candidatus Jordarchaeia archaeon]